MWRRLEVEDYDAVMSLRQAVLSSLPDPDFYVREDDEHDVRSWSPGRIRRVGGVFRRR